MSKWFQSRLLLALIALAFAIGYGHQVVDAVHAHEHGTASACHQPACEDGCAGEARQGSDSAGHCACCTHHSVTAVMGDNTSALLSLDARTSALLGLSESAPEAPVLGIEHPPQLA